MRPKFVTALLIIAFAAFPLFGQKLTTFKFERWTFSAEVMKLKKFQQGSTAVLVEDSKKIAIPTIFSLETPRIKRLRVTPGFEDAKISWLTKYPRSTVIPVHYYPAYESQGLNFGREAFVWIIADGRMLNVDLVRNGACSAETMLLESENEPYILIPTALYREVRNRILEAEAAAKRERLGIWSLQ